MKIKGIDNRKLILTEKEVLKIAKNITATFKINGNDYYLGDWCRFDGKRFEVVFISKDEVENEIEIADSVTIQKQAHWEIDCDGYYPYCSNCRHEPEGRTMTKYCENCGAKMVSNTK